MSTYLPNRVKILVGMDGTPPPSDLDFIFKSGSSKLYELGERVCLSNGAVFRYARAGAGITINKLCSSPLVADDHDADIAPVGASAASIGDKTIQITNGASTTITENMFQGGQFFVNDSGGEGQSLLIKSHSSAAVNSTCTIELYQAFHVAMTSKAQCGFVRNPFDGVIIQDHTADNHPIGVCNKAITSGHYFWLQTWGPTACLCDAGPPVQGGPAAVSSVTDGAVAEACLTTIAAGIYPTVGILGPLAGVSTETSPIWLTLCP